jgi:hypothetical protein
MAHKGPILPWTDEEMIKLPRVTKRQYPVHGTNRVQGGRLGGQTDTDYFCFICPECEQILQAEPLHMIRLAENQGYVLHVGVFCNACKLCDLVKISVGGGSRDGDPRNPFGPYRWQRVPQKPLVDDSPHAP